MNLSVSKLKPILLEIPFFLPSPTSYYPESVAGCQSPLDYFRWYLPNDLLDFIVKETNRYRDELETKRTKSAHITRQDILAFLGISFRMAVNPNRN